MSKSFAKRDKSIEVSGQRYILASSLIAEERLRVLKHEETFAIFDRFGEIHSRETGEEGVYHRGTRYLSFLDFSLGDVHPLLLSSGLTTNNILLAIDFTNSDFTDEFGQLVPRGSIHIFRNILLYNNCCLEHIRITNFLNRAVNLSLNFEFDADFRDIFEVRGTKRAKRGSYASAEWTESKLVMSYVGLDSVERHCAISFEAPERPTFDQAKISFPISLRDKEQSIYLAYDFCSAGDPKYLHASRARFDEAYAKREKSYYSTLSEDCRIFTSNEQFNNWLDRSYADIQMMNTSTENGLYPYAGVPWFSTTFGRDGIITALQTLWINHQVAKGVLSFLAHTQALDFSDVNDAEPGKILHEAREGEMANLNEIPFGRYYGSVDSTPLFVVLAGEYYRASGDDAFIRSIWENIESALKWIDDYGDRDKDGFVEYSRYTNRGLINQGWKDSHDSVFYQDGQLAAPPIALCEVQGYCYQAKLSAAFLCRAIGKEKLAERFASDANDLKERFHAKFWCEKMGTYALALDGEKRPCEVRSSNVGHCLFSGIVKDDVAGRVAQNLMSDKSFCGWGIRTIPEGEPNYNPMSYHNGSVWPHDTAIVAAGLARYGYRDLASRLLTGMFDASIFLDLNRLPELFCGFAKFPHEGPVLYPVSCAPQAWAAGSVFLLLKACLGLSIEAKRKRVTFDMPILPANLKQINISNLRVGEGAWVDLEIVRHAEDIGVNVIRRQGDVYIRVNK